MPAGRNTIDIQGTFEMPAANGFRITGAMGQPLMVMIQPATEVHFTGTASVDYLKPGMYVEFVAELDEKGAGKTKVKAVAVIGPTQEVGILPPEAAGAGRKSAAGGEGFGAAGGAAPGGGAAAGGFDAPLAPAGGGDVAGGKHRVGGTARKTTGAGGALAGTHTVRGKVTKFHESHLTVKADRKVVNVELAAEPEISVDSSDYSMAARGDKVSLKGFEMPDKRFVQAKSVTIEAAQTLSGAKKRPVRAEKTAKRATTKKASPRDTESTLPEPSDQPDAEKPSKPERAAPPAKADVPEK
ncbi:MAG: hypothetical protein ABSG68_03170 [Thermoguttaceae bacterium]